MGKHAWGNYFLAAYKGVFEHLAAKGQPAPAPVGLQIMVHGTVPTGGLAWGLGFLAMLELARLHGYAAAAGVLLLLLLPQHWALMRRPPAVAAAPCSPAGGGLSSSAAIVCSSSLAVMRMHGIELTKGVSAPAPCPRHRLLSRLPPCSAAAAAAAPAPQARACPAQQPSCPHRRSPLPPCWG